MQAKEIKQSADNTSSSLLDPRLKRLFPKPDANQASQNTAQAQLVELFKNTAFEQCRALGLSLVKEYPEHGIFWKILGAVHQNLGDNDAAINALNRAKTLLVNDADVLYNLGNAYFDLDKLDEALQAYNTAIELSPTFDKAYFNLASVYDAKGDDAEAEAAYRKSIEINPDEIQPYLKLASVLDKQERVDEAISLLSKITNAKHESEEIYISLAIELGKNGRSDEAKQAYEKAITLAPDNINLYNNYGLFLHQLNEHQLAEQYFLLGLRSADANAEILCSLGMLYYHIERFDQAEHCFKQAVITFPDSCIAFINLALYLLNTGKIFDSVGYGLKALEIEPDNTAALNNLGLAYQACGQFEESVEQFKKTIEIDPENIAALSNISLPLKRMGLFSEAETYIKQGLAVKPDAHDLLVNLASIYQGQGKIVEASTVNQRAIAVAPEKLMPYHNLLFDMCYSSTFSRDTIMQQLKAYGQMATKVATLEFNCWRNKPVGEKLRVGFVSADFILHPVTSFLTTVLENFDQTQFDLYAYSNNAKEDLITKKIKPHFKQWASIVGVSDENAARQIHADGIDILIDLSGHTGGTRLPMFAYKPSPVQVTWLGYWASTGIEQMDYILLDEVSAPLNIQNQFTETVKYLPTSRFCYSPPDEKIDVGPLPALRNETVTLGCYHNYSKVTDEVIALWSGFLQQQSALQLRWITSAFKDQTIIEEIQQRFAKHGIDQRQLTLLPSLPREEYLASFNELDFMIDAFPFTSCTTASDGLWMGVPTLAMAGNSLVARQSTSLMHAVGLPDWVAHDNQTYISKVLAFANDLPALAQIRASLRERIQASAFGDAALFTNNLETALKDIWQTHQHGNVGDEQVESIFKHVNTDSLADYVFVCATQQSEADYWAQTATGISLKKLEKQGTAFSYHIAFDNTLGLPEIYNHVIHAAPDDATVIFIHDDVWIDELDLLDNIAQGLEHFDMLGVAGNVRRAPKQANWLYLTPSEADDEQYLSGQVACGEVPLGLVNHYGPIGLACETLDGVLFAVNAGKLKQNQVQFDTRFKFHYYDMDFCRTAREAGLTLGTWALQITHQSTGGYDTKWYNAYKDYLSKWEPEATPDPFNNVNEALNDSIREVLTIADELQSNQDYAGAAELYREVLEIDNQHIEARYQYARMLSLSKSFDQATQQFESLLQSEPQTEAYWEGYISTLIDAGKLDQAEAAIGQAKSVINSAEMFVALESTLSKLKSAYSSDINELASALSVVEPKTHDRESQPVHWISKDIETPQARLTLAPELLSAYPKSLMIEYTSRCNLRCKYCSKSNPGDDQIPGRNMDMTPETVEAVIDLLHENHFDELLLAGTGESTFHPKWKEDFPRLIEVAKAQNSQCYVHVNTNFAMKYVDEDWAAFAQLDGVVISIDTADRELTKQVRSKSDLGLIIYNITRFASYCKLHQLTLPRLTINVTLYQEATAGLPELMVMLSSLPISSVSISDMFERAATDKHEIVPLNIDSPDLFKTAVKDIQRAIEIANESGQFALSIQPHLLARIEKLIGLLNQGEQQVVEPTNESIINSDIQAAKQTRMCLQPWSRFTIGADAAIFPCCVTEMDPTGTIDQSVEQDGINGTSIKQFRQSLLTGDVPAPCVNCTNATDCNTDELKQAVMSLAQATSVTQ